MIDKLSLIKKQNDVSTNSDVRRQAFRGDLKPDTVELSTKTQASNTNILTNILSTLSASQKTTANNVVYTSEQEKNFQQLISSRKIDAKTLEYFKTIFANGEPNLQFAYSEMLKMIGMDESKAPKLNVLTLEELNGRGGGFSPITGKLVLAKDFRALEGMRHELVHVQQNILMYRAFGKEKMIDAQVESRIRLARRHDVMTDFNKKFSQLSTEEIQKIKDELRSKCEKDFNVEFYEQFVKDAKPLTKQELELATKYMEDAYVYDGHSHGIIEKEAYKTDFEFGNKLNAFKQALVPRKK